MANKIATVTTVGLKLRASPNGEEIDRLAEGDRLEVMGSAQPGKIEWLLVKVIKARGADQIGLRGYVAAHGPNGDRFVAIEEVAPPAQSPVPPRPVPFPKPAPSHWPGVIPPAAWVMAAIVAALGLIGWLAQR